MLVQSFVVLLDMPNDKYMLYDAGHWSRKDKRTFEQIQQLIPEDKEIKLMILSHTIGNISKDFHINKFIMSVDRFTMEQKHKNTFTINSTQTVSYGGML